MSIFKNLLSEAVFVFGSNLAGRHGKGAAETARKYYHAEYGVGEGPTGMSYALPTMDENIRKLPLSDIQWYTDQFLAYARSEREKFFQVTRVGCGLAGYQDAQILPFFKRVPDNVFLPGRWLSMSKQLDRARLFVDGSEKITAATIEKTLSENTLHWGRRFEVVTSNNSFVGEVARAWARRQDIAWTPCPPDVERFGPDANTMLHPQLGWYCTHMIAFPHGPDALLDERILFLQKEGLKVKVVEPAASEQPLTPDSVI